MIIRMLAALGLLGLAGCQSYPMTLSASGPVQSATANSSQINAFRAQFEAAYATAMPVLQADGTYGAPRISGDAAIRIDGDYLSSGLALVDSNCMDYFHSEGRLQQGANVFRSLSNTFLPIASGALALSSGNPNAAAIVALIGAANNGVLNSVYRDFLFDSSNIDDVRMLVTGALSAHEQKVRANMADLNTAIDFWWVSNQINDHQAICQPSHILGIVKQSITNSTLIASNAGSPPTAPGAPAQLAPQVAGTNAKPPPPPHVIVKVAPSGNATPMISQTIPYAAPPNLAAFNKCLFPTMVSQNAQGYPLDASGNIVTAQIPKAKKDIYNAYMASVGYRYGGIADFIRGGGTSQQLVQLYSQMCP